MKETLQHRAEDLAAPLPPLLIDAERVAQAVYQGVHGRRRAGVGETFWQFRRYETGDPIERIDWRQSARTDKIFVREREWEAAQTAYLWADRSGSMHYASRKNLPTKADRAELLMLALASLLLRGGEMVQWLDRRSLRAYGKNALRSLAERIGLGSGDNSTPPLVPLARHAHVVLCSDFLMPPDEFLALMRNYADQNRRGILLHILDPAENDFPFEGRIQLLGSEGEDPLLVPNAAQMAEAYRRRMMEHKARLQQIAKSAGWFYLAHVTDAMPQNALLQIYNIFAAQEAT